MTGRMPRAPERYHTDEHDGDFAGCWRCQRAAAICRSKRSFDTYEAADVAVREVNEREAYASPLVRYRCRWCPGWHMTTARSRVRVKRAEKQRRKWLSGTEEPAAQDSPDFATFAEESLSLARETFAAQMQALDPETFRQESHGTWPADPNGVDRA